MQFVAVSVLSFNSLFCESAGGGNIEGSDVHRGMLHRARRRSDD